MSSVTSHIHDKESTKIGPYCTLRPVTGSERFTVLRELGKGGHGVVWEVRRGSDQRILALKVHNVGKKYWDESVREARSLKEFNSEGAPHIVKWEGDFDLAPVCYGDVHPNLCIGNTSEDLRRHAILMEVAPPNLSKQFIDPLKLTEMSRLSSSQVMAIGQQVLQLLNYLASKKMTYGDLKPRNMSCDAFGNLTLYDVGFTAKVDRLKLSDVVQSRRFRAPEGLLFKRCDESIDMWALAATLFELYTGTRLFNINGKDDETQTTIDHFYIIIDLLEEAPPLEFIKSAHPSGPAIFKSDGSLASPPSQAAEQIIEFNRTIGKRYPGVLVWKAFLYDAAAGKGESAADAERVIDLIAPMLRYEGRDPPSALLKKHFPSEEKKNGSD